MYILIPYKSHLRMVTGEERHPPTLCCGSRFKSPAREIVKFREISSLLVCFDSQFFFEGVEGLG